MTVPLTGAGRRLTAAMAHRGIVRRASSRRRAVAPAVSRLTTLRGSSRLVIVPVTTGRLMGIALRANNFGCRSARLTLRHSS